MIVPFSWTVAKSEFQSHWTSGRGFVHRGQRLLLSSRPPQKQSLLSTIRANMVRIYTYMYIDAVYDEIFRDWIASLSLSLEPSSCLSLFSFFSFCLTKFVIIFAYNTINLNKRFIFLDKMKIMIMKIYSVGIHVLSSNWSRKKEKKEQDENSRKIKIKRLFLHIS